MNVSLLETPNIDEERPSQSADLIAEPGALREMERKKPERGTQQGELIGSADHPRIVPNTRHDP